MESNNKHQSPENSEIIEQETVTPTKEIANGDANPSFPQEYEEQLSSDIRMKPQLLINPKKS